jgi:signal transduction histidine kinase
MDNQSHLSTPQTQPSDSLVAITHIFAHAVDWRTALDQVVPVLRAYMIFDNLVLYLPETESSHQLEVAYARVVGRGRSAGADINWGESIAHQVYESGVEIFQNSPPDVPAGDRLNQAYIIAFPIERENETGGALVLIRFGGPAFCDNDLSIGRVISYSLSGLLRYQQVQQKVHQLQAEQKQALLQNDFVSTITHELLTPLGFIKGYTTTLLRTDATWDKTSQLEFLSIIDQETDRLQELIDNLLDSARLQSGNMKMEYQPVRLDGLINDLILRTKTHHPDFDLRALGEQSTPPIQGDPRRLTQVFDNLLSNALKYAPGSPVTIGLRAEKKGVELKFQDTGPGIPAVFIPHLFERFFRNPEQAPNVRGTGLGLYICRQIIEAHNGKIHVESQVGVGTSVIIWLPCKQPGPEGVLKE